VDIRTKLIFALVAVALTSMFALGAAVAPRVGGFMRDGTLERLDELASSRSQALGWILDGWRDRAGLIASRTELRASLDEWRRTGSAAARERIRTILRDANDVSEAITLLRVHDADGALVAEAPGGEPPAAPSRGLPAAASAPTAIEYVGVEFDGTGVPQVTFVGPLTWDGRTLGTLVSVFEAAEVIEVTASYRGLGETGETLVFAEDPSGALRTLHPVRHDQDGLPGVVLPAGAGTLAARALAGEVEPVAEGVRDYRNEPVWAATRALPETGWGLIVKVDAREERQAYAEFTSWLRQTALILSAYAILAGAALGLRVALPIHALAEAANRIRAGDMKARAKVAVEDEVGVLARNFNEMADELEERVTLLREFRKFFDVSIDLMCIAGTDGFFRRTNPAFQKVLGWSDQELLDRPFFDFVHPDDVAKTQEEVTKLMQGIPTIGFENRYQCKDGTYRALRWTAYPEEGVLYAIARVVDHTSSA
jgi:PAS domain S-box-containing protein